MALAIEKPFILSDGKRIGSKKETSPEKPGNVPRVSRLLALALRYDQLMRQRDIPDFNTLAKLAGVSKPRITQIMNLINLAPDIQAEILTLPPIRQSRGYFTERKLRPIAQEPDWVEQRELWRKLMGYSVLKNI